MNKYTNKDIIEFLTESNAIEGVYDNLSLVEAKDAWDYAFKNRNKLDFDKIMEIHRLLLCRQRPDIAGHIRNCDVWIGGKRKVFISYALLKEGVANWISECKIDKRGTPKNEWENIIKNWHVKIEGIHPHEDGNGRTYRLIMNIQRFNLGLPIHIIHEGDEQLCYYGWFKEN